MEGNCFSGSCRKPDRDLAVGVEHKSISNRTSNWTRSLNYDFVSTTMIHHCKALNKRAIGIGFNFKTNALCF